MPSRWAGELDEIDFSDDEMDVGDVEPPEATGVGEDRVCGGRCLARIAALEETLGRVEGMVKMLVALGGLASPAERLEVEKRKGRMAREGDISVAKAGEQAKAEAVVKVVNKPVKRRELDDVRAEETRLRQEEVVKAKELILFFFVLFFFFFIVMFTSQNANPHVDGCRNRAEGRQDRSYAHPDHVTSGTKPSWTKGPS